MADPSRNSLTRAPPTLETTVNSRISSCPSQVSYCTYLLTMLTAPASISKVSDVPDLKLTVTVTNALELLLKVISAT